MQPTKPYIIDAETVHNWSQRYASLPHYATMPADLRAAIQRAHRQHHNNGDNARELAEALTARYPDYLELSAVG